MMAFLTFGKSAAVFVSEALGFVVKGKKLYAGDGKRRTVCASCSKGVTTRNLGGFFKGEGGAAMVCCDNPICMSKVCGKGKG